MTHSGQFNSDTAKEASRKAVEAKRAKAEEKKEVRDRAWAVSKGDQMYGELYDAAMGQGRFRRLAPDKSLAAVLKFMEFTQGKPVPMKPQPTGGDSSSFAGFEEATE